MRNSLLLPIFLAVVFVAPLAVHAEGPEASSVTVATVNITDAKVTQNERALTVGFTLTNRVGVQPAVRYAVSLAREIEGKTITVDRHVFDETLSLGEGAHLEKQVTYRIPEMLGGKLVVYVEATNGAGMPLGMLRAGVVTVNSGVAAVDISPSACTFRVTEDPEGVTYLSSRGVDVLPTEHLALICDLYNGSNAEVTLTPTLTTFAQNVFGKKLDTRTLPTVTVPKEESLSTTFPVTVQGTPGFYTLTLDLAGGDGKQMAPTLNASYFVDGAYASVQNIVLDKDVYSRGDTAKAALYWTTSLQRGGARHEEGVAAIGKAEVKLTSGSSVCGEASADVKSGERTLTVPLSVTRNCTNPSATVVLRDASGKVLGSETMTITSTGEPNAERGPERNKAKILLASMLLVTLVLGVIVLILMYRRKKATTTETPSDSDLSGGMKTLVFLLLLVGGLTFSGGEARAGVGDGECGTTHYNCDVGTLWAKFDNVLEYRWNCIGVDGVSGVVSPTCTEPVYNPCADNIDNDKDGLIDQGDPGCLINGVEEEPEPTLPSPPTVTVTVSPNNNGTPSIETVESGATWKVKMTSERATSCWYSRTGSYTATNFGNTPLSGTAYDTGNESLVGPGVVEYTFTCEDNYDQRATGKAYVYIESSTISPTPVVDLWGQTASDGPSKAHVFGDEGEYGPSAHLFWVPSSGSGVSSSCTVYSAADNVARGTINGGPWTWGLKSAAPITISVLRQYYVKCTNVKGTGSKSNTVVFEARPYVDLDPNPTAPAAGTTFSNPAQIDFTGDLVNKGTGQSSPTEDIYADLEVDWNNPFCGAATAEYTKSAGGPWTSLAAGGTVPLSASLAPGSSPLKNGSHCYRFVADPDNRVTELTKSNNATNWRSFIVKDLVAPQCSDGVDNDDLEDKLADRNDPGCYTGGVYDPSDNDETDKPGGGGAECSDTKDNADPEDTLADIADPGCHDDGNPSNPNSYNPGDNDETDGGAPTTQCANVVDDADPEDTLADIADPGCHDDGNPSNPNSYNPGDNDETDGGAPTTQCANVVDDADPEDTLADAADPGCHTDGNPGNLSSYDPTDNDETDGGVGSKQCSDGVDNSDPEDKLADDKDPGCYSGGTYDPNDDDETNNPGGGGSQCSDGVDNSDPEDTLADIDDPGCHSDWNPDNPDSFNPGDNNETNGQCSDNSDNDHDTKTDKADPDCHTDGDPTNDDSYDPTRNEDTPPDVTFEACTLSGGVLSQCQSGSKTIQTNEEGGLTWAAVGADSCVAFANSDNFSTGPGNPVTGSDSSITEPNPGNSSTFTIICTGPGGSTQKSVQLSRASAGPSITAVPPQARINQPIRLDWNAVDSDLTTCKITGRNVPPGYDNGLPSQTGSIPGVIIDSTTVFTISCDKGRGSAKVVLIPIIYEN